MKKYFYLVLLGVAFFLSSGALHLVSAQSTNPSLCTGSIIASSAEFQSQKSLACGIGKSTAITMVMQTLPACATQAQAEAALTEACNGAAPAALCTAAIVANSPQFVNRKQEACNTQYYATALDTLMGAPPTGASCPNRDEAKKVLDAACGQVGVNPTAPGSGAKDEKIPPCSSLMLTSNVGWHLGKGIGCINRQLAIDTFQTFPGSGCTSKAQATEAINVACGDAPVSGAQGGQAPQPQSTAAPQRGPTLPPKCAANEVYRADIGCISATVKAKCAANEISTDLGCFPNDPAGFATKFYGVGLGFISGLALLALIAGGYTLLTSKGEPHRVNVGKSYIIYAISGLLFAIFGVLFMETIGDVLKLPGM